MMKTSLGVVLLLIPAISSAAGLTGIEALDTPAITVKGPARVLLVAVTRAGGRLVAVGEHGVIIYSTDEGRTWSQAAVPVDTTLTCVGFASPLIGWSAGHFGVILKTVDGGETWKLQLNGVEANQLTLAAAQQAAQNTSVPGGAFAMRRATHFVADGPNKPFFSLLILSPQKLVVFGAYRMAMITTDGGQTWADWSLHVYDRLSHNLYDVAAIGSKFYLVGESGMVFCSTDDGNTFLPLAQTSDITLLGIVGPNPDSLIVFGVAGAGFRSTDKGKTWMPLNLTTQDDLTAGCVLSSGIVLLASETGALFRSKDNGATFQTLTEPKLTSAFDMIEAGSGKLAVVGASGVTMLHPEFMNT